MTFKAQMQADLDVFVNPDEHGVLAILSMDGVDKTINAILETVPDESTVFDALVTLITLKYVDAPDLDKKAIFIIEGKHYGVMNIPSDYAIQTFPTVVVNEVKV